MNQSIVSRGTFGMTSLCYVAWQGLRCVTSGILGLAVEDLPVLQHSTCGCQAYPKARLAAMAAINTRRNAGLWWGGRVQPESKLCKLQILCDIQGGNTCVRK